MSVEQMKSESRDNYLGYHQFMRPTHSGYAIFEVFSNNGLFYWSEYDDYWQAHVGFKEGPFNSSREAYRHALEINSSLND